ncbi:MAG: hypothetical protein LAQ69_31485 [Acidobacteriia bacterium]|nr:hypothetical protein [Terriglobia bacterium]
MRDTARSYNLILMAQSTNSETEDNRGILEILSAGAEIAGGAAGAAAGLMVAGPVGALIGGVGGPVLTNVLKKLGAEVHRRLLGPREQQRVGAVVAFAVERIKQRLDSGEEVRSDGFFHPGSEGRPAAEEVYEGVILAVQREHEEKKLPFMGNLMANLAFQKDIDRPYANYLVRLADNLSYRQLCLLLLFALKDKSMLRASDYRSVPSFSPALIGVLQEALELDQRGLTGSGSAAFGPSDINPAKSTTQGAGVSLLLLMELQKLPPQDTQSLIAILAK